MVQRGGGDFRAHVASPLDEAMARGFISKATYCKVYMCCSLGNELRVRRNTSPLSCRPLPKLRVGPLSRAVYSRPCSRYLISTCLQMLQLARPHSSSTGSSTFVFQLAQFTAFVSPCLIQIRSLYSQRACPALIGFKTAVACHWPSLPYLPPVFTPSRVRLEDFVRR